MARLTETFADRAVERSVADRRAEYAREMQRVVEATYGLIERSGRFDPPLRDILRETGLSTQAFYRYFQSKDELLLLLLDDGRRRLLGYLEHRMQRAVTTEDRVRAWVEGVLTQALQPEAAARTRPFVTDERRLAEAFPDEQQASVDLLVDQLAVVLAGGPDAAGDGRRRSPGARSEARRDAEAVYQLAFGALHKHLVHGTRPAPAEVEHIVSFCLRGCRLEQRRPR